ncbi:Uncharacterised protein [Kluyvera cryocrescens]|uniref:Uncharacterized protein n=1 Tax=Kluyvera cryocrescens TaxID=580 RepID=A0A485AF70_KLUCR|nr:Uncharacterised protein [Kluyvera cryocrescens]
MITLSLFCLSDAGGQARHVKALGFVLNHVFDLINHVTLRFNAEGFQVGEHGLHLFDGPAVFRNCSDR